ncbi:MAG: hypothetical protein ISS47_05600 [Candidatus Omnitrophica bacterium]|nr:hypothetical protein [Candidatus Omnitrophota bacterium]
MDIKKKSLKDKKILITSGPTWIPIDKVRIISNISSGQMGIYLSEELNKKGADVTLLLGSGVNITLKESNRVFRFKYFDEFNKLLKRKLQSKRYDVVIHAAAVADYEPITKIKGKLKSGIGIFSLVLKPTIKIIDSIKKVCPKTFLVAFKLDLDIPKNVLIKRALGVLKRSRADLVVANTFTERSYQAYIINPKGKILTTAQTKIELSKKLIKIIAQQL